MVRVSLTDAQRQELRRLARWSRAARMVRRAQGLLWLAQGEHPIAHRLRVTREAVYSWARRLRRESAGPLAQGLRDRALQAMNKDLGQGFLVR